MPCKKGSLVESLLPTKKWQSSKNKQNWVKQHQESFNHQTKLPPKNISFKTGSQVESLLATKKWKSFSWTLRKILYQICSDFSYKHVRMVMDVASLLYTKKSRVQFHPLTKENVLTFFFQFLSLLLRALYCQLEEPRTNDWPRKKKAIKKNKKNFSFTSASMSEWSWMFRHCSARKNPGFESIRRPEETFWLFFFHFLPLLLL